MFPLRMKHRGEGRRSLFSAILVSLYGMTSRECVRRSIRKKAIRLEGGEMYSLTLRRIFKKFHKVDVGLYSYGCFRIEDVPEGTVIGRYCSFAKGVVIFNANHPLERLSLHPFFYNPYLKVVEKETIRRSNLCIGHDVWFGRNSLILPNVRQIGNGAVIGAGAIVTKDVPSYAIVAGNPARVIKYRFSESMQRQVEATQWWTYSIEELKDKLEGFIQPVSTNFLESFPLVHEDLLVPQDTYH
ncbi:MAG: CatB-related O-acetyltransferase [Sedimentisphaerales bacterium]|nr:CatB-related O-acetyltransferase [Sedimentisphaerales bacterium]